MIVGPLLTDASAQWDSLEIERPSPAAQAKGGIQLLKEDRPTEAIPYLEHALTTDSLLVLPDHGAVAYWMGKAYAESGDSSRARSTWYQGFTQIEDAGGFDVRLADAYLRTLTRSQLRDERLRAVDAYFTLLGHVTPDTSTALKDLFRHRIAQIVPLMSDDVFAQTIEGDRSAEPATWTLRPHAGDSLQAWWRGLDPFPDTPENERLEEHLTRLVHARQTFSCPAKPGHLDRRGTVYLRFGAPFKRRELAYQDTEFFKEVFRFGVSIPPDAFPESELWIYPQIDDSGFYLFAEEGTTDCFYLARTNDLLPNTLTMQRGKSERGLNHAYSALMAMRSIYRELALYHISFSGRYSEIANYASYQEMEAKAAEIEARTGQSFSGGAQRQTTVGAGATARTVTENPAIGMEAPNYFVSRMVARAEREDEAAAQRREENMPRQYTALYDDTPQLPVAVRTARFLTADGRTRTEVYWGVSASAARLQPDEEDEEPAPSMIRFTATQHDADRSQVHRQNRRHQLPSTPGQQQQMFAPAPVSFEPLSSQQHLSLQWTQHRLWQNADGSVGGLGPKRRFTTARVDSLGPLRASGPAPEMSDLKVLSLPDTSAATLAQLDARAVPYPFNTITPDTPLLLAFEVYHLTYGDDDRTRYSLSYEVEGKTRRGWTRFFRGEDTQRTTTEMTREGSSRRTEEQILIDLSRIEQEEAQDVRVTVEVTDEVTGTSVTRSLDFVLRPREDS
jgi:GWxTD domain-containing protein